MQKGVVAARYCDRVFWRSTPVYELWCVNRVYIFRTCAHHAAVAMISQPTNHVGACSQPQRPRRREQEGARTSYIAACMHARAPRSTKIDECMRVTTRCVCTMLHNFRAKTEGEGAKLLLISNSSRLSFAEQTDLGAVYMCHCTTFTTSKCKAASSGRNDGEG